MTPARSRTTLVALLVTLAVTSGAAGLRLLAAEPGAAAPRRLLIDSAGLRAPVVPVGAGGSGAPRPATAAARRCSPATSTRPAVAWAP